MHAICVPTSFFIHKMSVYLWTVYNKLLIKKTALHYNKKILHIHFIIINEQWLIHRADLCPLLIYYEINAYPDLY